MAAIPTLTANLQLQISWNASRIDPILGTFSDVNQMLQNPVWQNAQGLATPAADQGKVMSLSVAASGTLVVDLTATSINFINDLTAYFDRLFGVVCWLPSVAQSALTNLGITTQASSITFQPGATNSAFLFGLVGTTSGFTLNAGEARGWNTPAGAGYPIHVTKKNLLFTNNDTVNTATILLGLIGSDLAYSQFDFSNPNTSMYVPIIF